MHLRLIFVHSCIIAICFAAPMQKQQMQQQFQQMFQQFQQQFHEMQKMFPQEAQFPSDFANPNVSDYNDYSNMWGSNGNNNWQQFAGLEQNWTNFIGSEESVTTGSNGISIVDDTICINGKCHHYRQSATFQAKDPSCPVAICPRGCGSDFRTYPKDDCPMCFCNGTGYREPCNSSADCSKSGKCKANMCTYGQLAKDLPKACVFTYECNDSMSDCGPKSNCVPGKRRHEAGKSCVFDNMCSDRFTCGQIEMTCFEDPKNCHIPGQTCVFDKYNMMPFMDAINPSTCPDGYRCVGMTCRKEKC